MTTSVNIDFSTYDYAQLAQGRPSGTSAVSLVNPPSGARFVVTGLLIANTTGSAATYSIYHDTDGATYTQATAIAYDISLPANSYTVAELSIPLNTTLDNLAVQTNIADAITFTAYGFKKRV